MSNAFAATKQFEREWLWIKIHPASHVFKKRLTDFCCPLKFGNIQPALFVVEIQRRRNVTRLFERFRKRNRIFHRKLGSRSNRKVRGMSGITDQNSITIMPGFVFYSA